MRDEVKKNSKDGALIKKITSEGGLVPFELTVKILINALIATPSQVSKKDPPKFEFLELFGRWIPKSS